MLLRSNKFSLNTFTLINICSGTSRINIATGHKYSSARFSVFCIIFTDYMLSAVDRSIFDEPTLFLSESG